MGGQYGVSNAKELVSLACAVAVYMAKKAKDGLSAGEIFGLLQDEAFKAAVGPALDNLNLVPSELGELDFGDGINLGRHTYEKVSEVLEAFKA